MAVTHDVVPLKNGDFIGRCQGMLPNKMQCTKAAANKVTSTDSDPEVKPHEEQLCEMHTKIRLARLTTAPILEIPNTGTVQAQAIPAGEFEVKQTEQSANQTEQTPETKEPEVNENGNTSNTGNAA